ncbi:hypothetical protein NLI96_g9856 [Meripilus lineatus]|uniref:YegS/DAGK C-terminal domain-containing protein n=1 Tax=Meripilus lineatus TaxID=2056292 RepID=A0AAD5YEU5_9APHY|nr:hypothetical protein NLI96_g9856 [Physisporinus lineatus]
MVKTLHSAQSLKFHPPFTLSTSTTTSPSISSTSEDTNDASEDASKSEGPTKTTVIPPGLGKEAEVLPPLRFASDTSETEGWITFDRPVSYMYAGKGPYVSVDLMQFPVSLPDDGFIDIVVQEQMTRGDLIKAMDGAEVGKCFWMNSQHYFKAEAYRVEPHSNKSCLSVDGEAYPFEPFQVEVHKGLATLLSPYGSYQAEFDLPN